MKKQKMYLRMITASLLRRRSRMLVALLAIAVGATILSGLVTIYYDVPRQMGEQFRNYGANMIFTSSDDTKLSQEEIDQGVAIIDASELKGAAPYRYETVRVNERPVLAAATDLKQVQQTSPYWKVDGAWPEKSGEVLLGKTEAGAFALSPGDTITLVYAIDDKKTENSDKSMEFTVTGILDTGGKEEDYIFLSTDDLQKLTGQGGSYDVAELSITATQDELTSYVEKISDQVDGLSARLVKRVTASETTVLSKLQALVFLVTAIVLLLTMICVATTMMAVVAERRKEVGLRKALGASNKSIIFEFMGEGLFLGAVGGLIGSILGYVFAQIVSINVFNSSIHFLVPLVPITIAISIVVTGISCMLPVRRAIDIDPALVLKGE